MTAPPATPDPDKNADVLNLPTDRQAKKKVEAAADYIKIQSWADAVRLLLAWTGSRTVTRMSRSRAAVASGRWPVHPCRWPEGW